MRLSWLPWLLLTVSCAGPLGRAQQRFEQGDVAAAVRLLRASEPELAELTGHELARYCLYRGLAELGLGDAELARRWLGRARRAAAVEPALYSVAEQGRLAAAWQSLGLLPGEGAP